MGGINHQPCGRYVAISTKLSRSLTLASAEFSMANVALEDLILTELVGGTGDIQPILNRLDGSHRSILDMRERLAELRGKMDELEFVDLPTLRQIDLEELGRAMERNDLHHSSQDWRQVSTIMQTRGFRGMVECFEQRIDDLLGKTKKLRGKIVDSSPLVADGNLHVTLEENRAGNFKAEFAALFTAWGTFQQLFLASSLISTEVWYRFNRNGSLVDAPAAAAAA